ncbi:MAG TPA: response regulator [Isosphaeraceae bacterium]|nr:response regulator [Isosphaeraceae bacterium]
MFSNVPDGPPAARILIVEDDKDTAESLALLLRLFGHETEVARTGPQAITIAQRQRPDYVILDIGLPGMDGYQVAQELKQAGPCKEAVIIAVTGYGQNEDRQRSSAAGIDFHLIKPVDHGVLLALMARSDGRSPPPTPRRHSHEPSADGPGKTAPESDHDLPSRGGPDPRAPGVAMSLACSVWRGDEAAGRPVPSPLLGDRPDK